MRVRIIWASEICIIVKVIQKPNSRIVQFSSIRKSVRPSGPFIQFNCPYVRSMCPRVRPSNPLVWCICPSIQSVWSVRLVPFGLSVSSARPSNHPVCLAIRTVLLSSSSVSIRQCVHQVVLPSGRLIQFVRLSVHPVCPSVLVFRP